MQPPGGKRLMAVAAIRTDSGASAAPANPAVSLADIDITFGLKDGGRYTAVKGVSLDVRPGEFVAVCGPTGCGKSTLLNAAAGLLQPAPAASASSATRSRASTCARAISSSSTP